MMASFTRLTGPMIALTIAFSGCARASLGANQLNADNSSSSNGSSSLPTPTPAPGQSATPTPTPSAPVQPTPAPRPSSAGNQKTCSDTSTTVAGIDVSDYDAGTNWTEVAKSGIGFAFIKATEGTDFTNPYFKSDWANAKASGVLRGAYHFFHADDDPTVQAQFFVQTMGALGVDDLPAVLDWEVTDGETNATQISNAKTFLMLVEAATGKRPIIYTGPAFFNALDNPQEFYEYPLFIANYDVTCPDLPPPWSKWTFWQSGDSSKVSGVVSDADSDLFNGSAEELLNFAQTGSH